MSTVPLKGKLIVSTRFSKLDSRVAKVETFEFRDARIESRESRVEDRESRNEEFWNIHELEFVREFAIHLSKKDNNYVTQFQLLHMSAPSRVLSLHYGVTVRKEYLTGIETSRVKTFKENKLKFRTFAETSSSETRIVFARIAINEENGRIQTNIEQQSKHGRHDTYNHGNLGYLFQSPCEVFLFNTYPYCS